MVVQKNLAWPVVDPFIEERVAGPDDIDEFGHVNNLRYPAWALDTAWAHSAVLGFTIEDYKRIGVGCVVWRHEFDYVAPVLEGETILVGTWIASNDGRLRTTRAYEMRRKTDGAVCFRGQTLFVTIDMKSGKPARMPKSFAAYQPATPA